MPRYDFIAKIASGPSKPSSLSRKCPKCGCEEIHQEAAILYAVTSKNSRNNR
jgi:hypothetical protein